VENTLEELHKISQRSLVSEFIKTLDAPTICEVGVRTGDNFDFLLMPNVKTAIGVDIWRETGSTGQNDNLYDQNVLDEQYSQVFHKYWGDSRVRLIREFSKNAAQFFEDETFDFIYIDADHTYDAVTEDLEAWYPKLKVGGVLGGHDYISKEDTLKLGHSVPFGVIDAVTDFRERHGFAEGNFHLTYEAYASYYMVKE
jgi:hypothetical protein